MKANRRNAEPRIRRRRSPFWNSHESGHAPGDLWGGILFLYHFPESRLTLNPFGPEASQTAYFTDTPTSTIIQLPATWTFTPTLKPSATRTKASTWTLLPEMITPSPTGTFTITPPPGTQTTTPTPKPVTWKISFATSTTYHPESGCNWLGVGGKVVDSSNKPILFQTLQLGGILDGKTVNQLMLSGSAPEYGVSGFEFVLSDHPIASTQTLWIQLYDNAGTQLTEKIPFDTSANCTQNLVLFTFTKVH